MYFFSVFPVNISSQRIVRGMKAEAVIPVQNHNFGFYLFISLHTEQHSKPIRGNLISVAAS